MTRMTHAPSLLLSAVALTAAAPRESPTGAPAPPPWYARRPGADRPVVRLVTADDVARLCHALEPSERACARGDAVERGEANVTKSIGTPRSLGAAVMVPGGGASLAPSTTGPGAPARALEPRAGVRSRRMRAGSGPTRGAGARRRDRQRRGGAAVLERPERSGALTSCALGDCDLATRRPRAGPARAGGVSALSVEPRGSRRVAGGRDGGARRGGAR